MPPDLFVLFIIGPVVAAALLAAFHKWALFQRGVSLAASLGAVGAVRRGLGLSAARGPAGDSRTAHGQLGRALRHYPGLPMS